MYGILQHNARHMKLRHDVLVKHISPDVPSKHITHSTCVVKIYPSLQFLLQKQKITTSAVSFELLTLVSPNSNALIDFSMCSRKMCNRETIQKNKDTRKCISAVCSIESFIYSCTQKKTTV